MLMYAVIGKGHEPGVFGFVDRGNIPTMATAGTEAAGDSRLAVGSMQLAVYSLQTVNRPLPTVTTSVPAPRCQAISSLA